MSLNLGEQLQRKLQRQAQWRVGVKTAHVQGINHDTDSSPRCQQGAWDDLRAWIISLSWENGCRGIWRWPPYGGRKGRLRRVKAKSQGHEDESANTKAQRGKGSGPTLAVSHPACPAHTVPVAPNIFGMKSNSSTWLRMPLMGLFKHTFQDVYPTIHLTWFRTRLPCPAIDRLQWNQIA